MVWSVLRRLTPTQPMVMQSDAIRGRGGPQGLISTYTMLFPESWNGSTALYRFNWCVLRVRALLCVFMCAHVHVGPNFNHK